MLALTLAFAVASSSASPIATVSVRPATIAEAARPGRTAPSPTTLPGVRALDAGTLGALRDTPLAWQHTPLKVPLPEGGELVVRFIPTEIMAQDAKLLVATKSKRGVTQQLASFTPDSDLTLFAGSVEGMPGATAFLALAGASARGAIAGFVRVPSDSDFRMLWIGSDPTGAGHPTVVFDPTMVPPGALPAAEIFCHSDELMGGIDPVPTGSNDGVAGGKGNPCREVLLAIDTDVEYTANLFSGNQAAAIAYAITLTAATSEIYTADLNVRFRVSYVRLWTGDDPWTEGGATNQLFQYRDYWVANEEGVERDLGHFLSGRGLGGGVAWLPGLCGAQFAFGLSGNLGGSFPYPLLDHSNANWDIMVFAHELGHNFGAPHTHSYDPPLDGCGNGDCSLAAQGTIMSYCHICSGGLANIALHFHPENVASMSQLLAEVPCIDGGVAGGAFALDDYAVVGAGESVAIDPLFNDERANCESLTLTSFDPITLNGATVTLNPGNPDERPILLVTTLPDASGIDSFSYSVLDSAGAIDTATVSIDAISVLPAAPVVGSTPGVVADYYEIGVLELLPNFSQLKPYMQSIVPAINFPSTNGGFATSGRSDLVAAVFEGWVDVPSSGVWTFFAESDDGSKLFVDDILIVSNDGLHAMVEQSGVIGLAAGYHQVRFEFFERDGGAGAIARMSGPGFGKAVIPAERWSHGGSAGADLNADGSVDAADLAMLLGAWGGAGPLGDLDQSGVVDAADLALLLGGWTG